MVISTQLIGNCSLPIPQPGTSIKSRDSLPVWRRPAGLQWSGGFRKSGGSTHSTKVSKQELSSIECRGSGFRETPFSSSGEDTSAAGVPAKGTSLRDFTGMKTIELMDSISLAKLVDDQLPPLLSIVIDGLPPIQISKHVDEAEKLLHQYVKRYPDAISFESYCRVGLSAAAYGYPGATSANRILAIAISYALQFLVDDIFFDDPSDLLDNQYGISHDTHGSSQKIQECFDCLDAIFSQQVQPSNPAPLIETLMWESGRDMLKLSNPAWFNHYVTSTMECHSASIASHADLVQGHNLIFQDVESYAAFRTGNIGGKFVQLNVEFASDSYIPEILRTNPYLENLTSTTSIYLGFVNDIFSYYRESAIEQNPRNLISVLLECEGKPFAQTMHMAIGLVNTYGRAILDLESQAWNSTLKNHMERIKALIAGSIYYGFLDHRNRHPDSVFPEHRDMTNNWKILAHAKVLGL